ncbi:VRR-NUC domain-containing protein [Paenibacillus sp. GYB004]|uniref:VRR-NUC domain-containing protein n=1 Tax=Paenibacillus sp. GYB004 TaxID=2994393 RepID=UPI002F96594F
MRESSIEARLVREVERIGGLAPKFVSPGNSGVPDRIVILPGGWTVYVETKAPGKPLKPLQAKWAKELTKRGHRHYKIDSYADIDRFIAEVMVPK